MGRLIAIFGGIGSGKSVVSHVLSTMGYDVYDCDQNAKILMDNDCIIKQRLKSEINTIVVDELGTIDRNALAEIVFNDADMLRRLNTIVHEGVRKDLLNWCNNKTISFVETAILYQSGIDKLVDEAWEVIAPEDLRIARVMKRSSLLPDQIKARIESQNSFIPDQSHKNVKTIVNDGFEAILPQINSLLHESIII